jgi:hypothetical protein
MPRRRADIFYKCRPIAPSREAHDDRTALSRADWWPNLPGAGCGSTGLPGGPGFEPRLTESESAILALNYPPPERTVGEARERHLTARFELLRQSRPDRRGGSCGGPNGHFRPVWRNGQCWRPLRYIKIFFISVAGHQATRPLTASHGQFCRNWPIATH